MIKLLVLILTFNNVYSFDKYEAAKIFIDNYGYVDTYAQNCHDISYIFINKTIYKPFSLNVKYDRIDNKPKYHKLLINSNFEDNNMYNYNLLYDNGELIKFSYYNDNNFRTISYSMYATSYIMYIKTFINFEIVIYSVCDDSIMTINNKKILDIKKGNNVYEIHDNFTGLISSSYVPNILWYMINCSYYNITILDLNYGSVLPIINTNYPTTNKNDIITSFIYNYGHYNFIKAGCSGRLYNYVSVNSTIYTYTKINYVIPFYTYKLFNPIDNLISFDGNNVDYNYKCIDTCQLKLSYTNQYYYITANGFISFTAEISTYEDNVFMQFMIMPNVFPIYLLHLKKGIHLYNVNIFTSLNACAPNMHCDGIYKNVITFQTNCDNLNMTIYDWKYGGISWSYK